MSNEQITKLSLGLKIKEIRMKRGISQKNLAQMLGISPGRLSNWENGASFPDFKYMPELSCALGCSFDYLLGINFNNRYDELIGGFELLNDTGRAKAIEYIKDLSLIRKYCYGVNEDEEQKDW